MRVLVSCYPGIFHCAAALLLAALPLSPFAQNYPVKPVRPIAPFPPGGSSDLIARIVAQRLSEGFPNQFNVAMRRNRDHALRAVKLFEGQYTSAKQSSH